MDNMPECYLCLSLKTIRMFKWVQNSCSAAEFIVKMDDDIFLNLHKVFQILRPFSGTKEGQKLIGGNEINMGPIRNPTSKWFVPKELWPDDFGRLPRFVGGPFYVLGNQALKLIYERSLVEDLFHLEDVYVSGILGTWKLGLNITKFTGYRVGWIPRRNLDFTSCKVRNDLLVVHFHVPAWNYVWCWRFFNSKDFVCNKLPLYLYC